MRLGLLGHPLSHSLSPLVHRLLAQENGHALTYELFDIPRETFLPSLKSSGTPLQALPASLEALFELDGFNITAPYKEALIPYLTLDPATAALMGAVNTVNCKTRMGYNTDCVGFVRSLGVPIEQLKTALIVGAGGTGRMFAYQLLKRGVAVTFLVRESSVTRAAALTVELLAQFPDACVTTELQGAQQKSIRFDLLINATPVGMYPNTQACPLEREALCGVGMVFDSIYNPPETLLLKAAQELGIPTVNGLSMLVWQAAAAQEYWFSCRFTTEQVERVTRQVAAAL